ncbi:hypothetical protein DMH18_26280 [Streptomyces sp. WAC 06783]|uniref:hypothetical protein n=1 Tax=Streptomyces sp. WAC 06783 TaxID=2203211 RepID=UPI000F74B032|nr:hypothetical protein [Streptomyces sp. WAC 06783]RSO06957.1 hypothetical protein DMH18_26280 [Streptomyces sp. WAC 06783]
MSLADECGTDVEIYRRAFGRTIYAGSRTAAPETLLALLDSLGLQRHGQAIYLWHQVPDHLPEAEQHQLASRAVPWLHAAGYRVNIAKDIFDEAAYEQAARQAQAQRPGPPRPPVPASHSARAPRSRSRH